MSNTSRETGPAPELAVLGLGSNLGDRLEFLRDAAVAIAELAGVTVVARSGVYETPPISGPPQGHYLNAALAIHTTVPLVELLAELLRIERSLGRVRPDPLRWGPRTIDIDILWAASGRTALADLVVPHARLGERPFALRPLLDVVPDARDPATNERYADWPAARADLPRIGQL